VSIVKAKAKKHPQVIAHYTTISPELAHDVMALALLLQVPSRITKYKTKEAYQITFSAPALAKIAVQLSCAHPKKQVNLLKLASWDFTQAEGNSRDDTVPMSSETATKIKALVGNSGYIGKKTTDEEIVVAKQQQSLHEVLSRAKRIQRMGRSTFETLRQRLGDDVLSAVGGQSWFDNASNPNLVWDYLEEVIPLPGKRDAWDITVPEGNTFMTASQLIVFDTLQIHTPVSLSAVTDAKAMTLSHLLFHDKSKNDLLVFPQHEAIMGVDHASTADLENKPVKFKNTADAMKAYHEGKIQLGTRVIIGD
jgi:hypothetical protein